MGGFILFDHTGSNTDGVHGIALDPQERAYVTGYTESPNFPRVNPLPTVFGGFVDGFVAKLNKRGTQLVYSTYLGGSADSFTVGEDIAVDSTGQAYVIGFTESADFPTTDDALQPTYGGAGDAFIVKIR
jgi:Beta-propeller repeat